MEKEKNKAILGIGTMLFVLVLILFVGTASAEDLTWTAKSDWDVPDVGTDNAKPAFADLDGDGDYDLLVGEFHGASFAYENTGTPSSPVWTAKPGWNAPNAGWYAAPTFADLDGDGDYDLLIGEHLGASFAYENTACNSVTGFVFLKLERLTEEYQALYLQYKEDPEYKDRLVSNLP